MTTKKPRWQESHGRLRDEPWLVATASIGFCILLVIFLTSVRDGYRKPKPWQQPDQPIATTQQTRDQLRHIKSSQ